MVGDKVLLKDTTRKSKFHPIYHPITYNVVEVSGKGVIVVGKGENLKDKKMMLRNADGIMCMEWIQEWIRRITLGGEICLNR